MGVHAVQKTEADAIIEHLLALDDAPPALNWFDNIRWWRGMKL